MNLGIIVFSQTGNTHCVAERLKDELKNLNHEVKIERLKYIEHDNISELKAKALPNLDNYDSLIIGAYVEGFSLVSGMKKYLTLIPTLKDKDVICFVTKALPFKWTGGKQAVGQMKKLCAAKDASVIGTGIVRWTKRSKEKDIIDLATYVCNLENERREISK